MTHEQITELRELHAAVLERLDTCKSYETSGNTKGVDYAETLHEQHVLRRNVLSLLCANDHAAIGSLLSAAERCLELEGQVKQTPSAALQRVQDDHGLYCRPLRLDSHIIMYHDTGLRTFYQSDNGIRLERAEYDLGPEWFLPNVKWIVLSDLSLAFKNYEDPQLQAALSTDKK